MSEGFVHASLEHSALAYWRRSVPFEEIDLDAPVPPGHRWSLDYRLVTDGTEQPHDIIRPHTTYPQHPRPPWWQRAWRRRHPLPPLPPVLGERRFRPIAGVLVPPLGYPVSGVDLEQ